MSPFEIIDSVTYSKKPLFDDPEADKAYSAFIVNKGLALYSDTVMPANEMNRYSFIPVKWQFDYLINTITKRKRYSKWVKKMKLPADVELIMSYYGYSATKAIQALSLLTPDQLSTIKERTSRGGNNGRSKVEPR